MSKSDKNKYSVLAPSSINTAPRTKIIVLRRETVVLDIDETLLHTYFAQVLNADQSRFLNELTCAEVRENIPVRERNFHFLPVGTQVHICQIRRGMWSMFENLISHRYNIVIWSAGELDYVNAVCNLIFGELKHTPLMVLCRNHCSIESPSSPYASLLYTKPLSMLKLHLPIMPIEYCLLVDNRKENGVYFPNQLVHVKDFNPTPWATSNCGLEDRSLLEEYLPQIHLHFHKLKNKTSR